MWFRPIFTLMFAGAVVCVACKDGDDDPGNTSGTTNSGKVSCATDPRVATFASGITARSTSGKLVAEILNADPSPPRRGAGDGGFNTWTMKFAVEGSPPGQGAQVKVTTLMPDHGHGSPRVPVVTANDDGTYAVAGLYFFMAGVWEISFSLDAQETAKFAFCVE